jgi:hypothetical protein
MIQGTLRRRAPCWRMPGAPNQGPRCPESGTDSERERCSSARPKVQFHRRATALCLLSHCRRGGWPERSIHWIAVCAHTVELGHRASVRGGGGGCLLYRSCFERSTTKLPQQESLGTRRLVMVCV